MQSLQVVALAQGSAVLHSEESHAQLEHEPLSGPVELPVWQPPPSPHQPHG